MTANAQRPVRLPAGGLNMEKLKLAGYTNYAGGSTAFEVYKGACMMCDVSDTDGYFAPKQSGINAASGDIFGGIAAERQSVTSADTADGSVELTVFTNGIWGFPKGNCAITDIGAPAYASDDGTITPTSTNAIAIGTIVDVDATYVWVDISDYFMKPI
jgi:hypothetical protein